MNLCIWNLCDPCLFTAKLSLILPPPDSGPYHNLLPWMIGHQVHSNAFACLSGYGQSDCGCSHLEMSKYIYGCCDVATLHFYIWQSSLVSLHYHVSFHSKFSVSKCTFSWYYWNVSNTRFNSSYKLACTLSILSFSGAWPFRTIIWYRRPLSIM
jgi:hypothetical protein